MILSLFWGIRWPITQNPWRSWHSSATSRTDSTAPACCIDQRTTSHPTLVSLLLKELLDATCPNKNGISRLSRTSAMCLSLSLSPGRVHRPVAIEIFAPCFENLWNSSPIIHHDYYCCLPPMAQVNRSYIFFLPHCSNITEFLHSIPPLEAGSSKLIAYFLSAKMYAFPLSSLLATEFQRTMVAGCYKYRNSSSVGGPRVFPGLNGMLILVVVSYWQTSRTSMSLFLQQGTETCVK